MIIGVSLSLLAIFKFQLKLSASVCEYIELLLWYLLYFRIEETNLEDGQTTISSDKFLNDGNDHSEMTDISKFYEEIHGEDQNLGDCWDDSATTFAEKVKAKVGSDEPAVEHEVSGPTWDDPDYSKLIEFRKRGVPEFDLASPR